MEKPLIAKTQISGIKCYKMETDKNKKHGFNLYLTTDLLIIIAEDYIISNPVEVIMYGNKPSIYASL